MEVVGKEKYLTELDITLIRAKFLINTLSNECNDNDLQKHLNVIQDISEDVQNKIIDIS
jgi:hypothetical protein